MGEYADVKRRKMLKLLRWLEVQPGFFVGNGGKHQWVVKHASWLRPFLVPFKHNVINKHIVHALMQKVTATGGCTKEEFDEWLK